MTTRYNIGIKKHFLCSCLCLILLFIISSCKETTTSRSLSEQEFHYDDRLSTLAIDKKGYWIGGETGVIWHVDGQNRKRFYTGLDRIYDIERDPNQANQIWIASRNAGLQLWNIAADTLVHKTTFEIPSKGNRYSPYNIDIADGTLFVATSQGLFSMPLNQQQQGLKPLYPIHKEKAGQYYEPFLVNNLCHVGNKWLFAATQAGVISINLQTKKTELRHKGENIRSVAIYDGKLYILSDNQLTIESFNGADSKTFSLPQSVLSFYKASSTYYFITSSSILLSDNLKRFVTIPLRNNIPDNPHQISIADDGNGFSVLLTKNAVWRIPHHLGFFNANPPVLAACLSDKSLIYVNNQHELFCQKAGEQIAKKIYDFENDELPKEMYANGEDIYYYNANNQLFRLNLGNHYLINQLFKRPQLLAQTKTRITSMAFLPRQSKILLGVQDYLLSIDTQNGKTDTIKAMDNRYITAFHQVKNGEGIYCHTQPWCILWKAWTDKTSHDSNIASVDAALGVEEYSLPNSIEKKTPIGSKLVLEKWVDAAGKAYIAVNLVYQSTDQLKQMSLLDLQHAPQVFSLKLKGLNQNTDGLYTFEDVNALFLQAIRAYDDIK